jgi:hypothetical protein
VFDERLLNDASFAWPEQRKFPIHIEKQAVISFLYAENQMGVPEKVRNKIKEALEVYRIPIEHLSKKETKIAAEKDCLIPENKTYPVRNIEEIKTAEYRIHSQLTKLQPLKRAQLLSNLVKKAQFVGVEPKPLSLRYAGLTESEPQELIYNLRIRAGAAKTAEFKEKYNALADAIQKSPQDLHEKTVQVKIANLLMDLDSKAELTHLYDSTLVDPIAVVFNTSKLAEARIDLNGTSVPVSKLAALGSQFFSDFLGPQHLSEITDASGQIDGTKLAMVLKHLPPEYKTALAAQLGT